MDTSLYLKSTSKKAIVIEQLLKDSLNNDAQQFPQY
jgi:hypothetical protein